MYSIKSSFPFIIEHILTIQYEKNAFGTMMHYPLIFFAASFMGLGVNYLIYLVIQATSSLTMKVLSTIRNIGIIFIGVAAYGEIVTFNQGLGYTIALIGFAGYNAAQMGYWKEIYGFGADRNIKSENDKQRLQDTDNEEDVDDDIEMSSATDALLKKGNGSINHSSRDRSAHSK